MKKITLAIFYSLLAVSIFAQSPTKRGMCYNHFTPEEEAVMLNSKVTWCYNWAQAPGEKNIGPESSVEFMPMIWGAGEDFDLMMNQAREYLSKTPGVKVLLGFNEPMMKNKYGGCDLTPLEAAKLWPQIEDLAKEFNLELASPALTWGFEALSDGKIYGAPEEWLDTFIAEYKKINGKEPHFDYLVLHSYMDYPSAVMWFCDKYSDYYNKKVLLTEFCAWDQDPNQMPHQSLEAQISSMTQKVEAMDNDEKVAGYAWFMSHAAVDSMPYNSVFTKFKGKGDLTELGKVYLYMSDCDKSKWFNTNEIIPAYLYVSSSNYNMTVGEKPEDGKRFSTPINIESASDKGNKKLDVKIPLQLGDFSNKRFANYQVKIPESKTYTLNLRILSNKEQIFVISSNGKEILSKEIPSTKNKWKTISLEIDLEAGDNEIQIKTLGNAKTVKFNWFTIK